MLHLHTGNRLEDLADALIDASDAIGLRPLASWTLVCESASLSRWLKQRFCMRCGIACLLDTRLPAEWLWSQARAGLSLHAAEDPLSRERMHWRLFSVLDDDSPLWRDGDGMAPVARYLQDDRDDLKRWQLAGRLADVFDRYQYYRPELIRRWSAGGDRDDWQARLWRAIAADAEIHRVALMDRFLDKLRDGTPPGLPPRVDLFAIHNLPPLLLEAISAIARRIPVHLWLLAPTPEYWADLDSPRRAARRRLEQPEAIEAWQAGNPLLTQWGRQGQALQDMLLDEAVPLHEDGEHFMPPVRDSLLHRVQADIYAAQDEDEATAPEDIAGEPAPPTIQIHVCHSPLRECQVLHDTLLHALQADPDLEPEDILVLVPEISRYAPYIEAVFSGAEADSRLPFNVSDVLQADEHPLVQAFLGLLDLPESRFTRAEVLGLLDLPEVLRRFGLEAQDMTWLAETFDALRIFWGLDAAHKSELGLPGIGENTWRQGFRRIMAGFATGCDELLAAEPPIAPLPRLTAQAATRAARFFDLLDSLRQWSRRLGEPAGPADWAERLSALLDDLFTDTGDDQGRLDHIREALAELARAEENGDTTLPLPVVRHWLRQTLETVSERGRFYSGGVTFCGMKPLRGVPFRVIVLLGMQESAYPRRRAASEFDRLGEGWRHGDPDPVQEDRYLFLEALLAARDRLVVSYTGRDQRTNEPLQPSVLVQELLDYLERRYRIDGRRPGEALTRVHPLQPYAAANFTGEAPGHDRRWLATARAILEHEYRPPRPGWPTAAIAAPEAAERRLSPRVLADFLRDPLAAFLRQRLQLDEPRDVELQEDEPFEMDGLAAWQLRELLIERWLRGEDETAALDHARARGMLPHGPQGEIDFSRLRRDVDALRRRCRASGVAPPLRPLPADVDLAFDVRGQAWRLSGRIEQVYAGHGLLAISPGRLSSSLLLPLWIAHLCLHASRHPRAGQARLVAIDDEAGFDPVDHTEARELLADLLAIHLEGLERPLPLPRRSVARYAEDLAAGKAPDQAIAGAAVTWNGWSGHHAGERQAFAPRVILRGQTWQPDETMATLADRILEPLRRHLRAGEPS